MGETTEQQRERLARAYCLLIEWGRERLAREADEADTDVREPDGAGEPVAASVEA